MGDSGFDVSGLNLLPEEVADLAAFDSNTKASDADGVQDYEEERLLAAHLEKAFFIPKKKSSKFEDSTGVSSLKTEESARFIHVSDQNGSLLSSIGNSTNIQWHQCSVKKEG